MKEKNSLDSALDMDELDRLDDFLMRRLPEDPLAKADTTTPGVFNVYQLDGLMAALNTMPEFIKPSQWLEAVWGDFPPQFEDTQEAEWVLSVIVRLYNEVSQLLREGKYEPLWVEEKETWQILVEEAAEGGEVFSLIPLSMWVEGYMLGIALFSPIMAAALEEIEAMMERERAGQTLDETDKTLVEYVALPLVYGYALINHFSQKTLEPMEGFGEPAVAEKVLERLEVMPGFLYEVLEPERARHQQKQAVRRAQPKVGRNDPCPCGSGKKYKKCCLQ